MWVWRKTCKTNVVEVGKGVEMASNRGKAMLDANFLDIRANELYILPFEGTQFNLATPLVATLLDM